MSVYCCSFLLCRQVHIVDSWSKHIKLHYNILPASCVYWIRRYYTHSRLLSCISEDMTCTQLIKVVYIESKASNIIVLTTKDKPQSCPNWRRQNVKVSAPVNPEDLCIHLPKKKWKWKKNISKN